MTQEGGSITLLKIVYTVTILASGCCILGKKQPCSCELLHQLVSILCKGDYCLLNCLFVSVFFFIYGRYGSWIELLVHYCELKVIVKSPLQMYDV